MRMTRTFHPVGQGAFYSESFQDIKDDGSLYHVVFDCGSSTDTQLPTQRINEKFKNREEVHKVFISHFDQDHINGLQDLLKICNVKEVYLPYLTQEERIFYLVKLGIDSETIDSFIVKLIFDPLEIIKERSPETKVFFVTSEESDLKDIEGIVSGSKIKITTKEAWGFIPYHFREKSKLICFMNNLKSEKIQKEELTGDKFQKNWEDINFRNKLISVYDKVPGSRNTNCMVVYSGPLSKFNYRFYGIKLCKSIFCICRRCFMRSLYMNTDVGCLYTGDYDAKGKQKWNQLKHCYRQYWNLIGLWQIPHHGSNLSYNNAISKLHKLYVISAGHGNNHGHPHKEVLEDLDRYDCQVFIVNQFKYSKIEFIIASI